MLILNAMFSCSDKNINCFARHLYPLCIHVHGEHGYINKKLYLVVVVLIQLCLFYVKSLECVCNTSLQMFALCLGVQHGAIKYILQRKAILTYFQEHTPIRL